MASLYALPNQKTQTVTRVLVEELVQFFGIPEALLSDRGNNLLSHLMKDLCKMLEQLNSIPLPITLNVMEWLNSSTKP